MFLAWAASRAEATASAISTASFSVNGPRASRSFNVAFEVSHHDEAPFTVFFEAVKSCKSTNDSTLKLRALLVRVFREGGDHRPGILT